MVVRCANFNHYSFESVWRHLKESKSQMNVYWPRHEVSEVEEDFLKENIFFSSFSPLASLFRDYVSLHAHLKKG